VSHARSVRPVALVASVVFLTSCSGGSKLHPVTGTVLYQEQPIEGATVVFQPTNGAEGASAPSGMTGPDGKFKLRTHPHGDGAPAGKYKVLITWYPANAREQENPKNRLPERYGNPTDTPLDATVNKGPNELEPFRLTK
jgi:hypothetical protein